MSRDLEMNQAIQSLGQIDTFRKWTNRIWLIQMKFHGVTKWAVQVKPGFAPICNMDISEFEMRDFDSGEEANGCFQTLNQLKHVYPPILLRALKTY